MKGHNLCQMKRKWMQYKKEHKGNECNIKGNDDIGWLSTKDTLTPTESQRFTWENGKSKQQTRVLGTFERGPVSSGCIFGAGIAFFLWISAFCGFYSFCSFCGFYLSNLSIYPIYLIIPSIPSIHLSIHLSTYPPIFICTPRIPTYTFFQPLYNRL